MSGSNNTQAEHVFRAGLLLSLADDMAVTTWKFAALLSAAFARWRCGPAPARCRSRASGDLRFYDMMDTAAQQGGNCGNAAGAEAPPEGLVQVVVNYPQPADGSLIEEEAQVKPAPFTYAAPSTLEEALTLLGEYGDAAKLLAGGQSLMPMLNLRLARPQYIVDLNRIPGLEYMTECDGSLVIGALTRQRSLERSPSVRQGYPLVYEATTLIGHRAIRNRGTVGGSIAHADPAAELPAVLVAHGGSVQVQGPRGTRQIAATDFFRAYLTTALEPDEILTEVRLPSPPTGTGWCFMEESRRHGDFAMVGVAVLLTLDAARRCTHVAIVLCGVGGAPHQVAAAPAILLGHTVDAARLRDVAQAAASEIEPESDLHASAEFRRHLSTVLIRRAVHQAAERATL